MTTTVAEQPLQVANVKPRQHTKTPRKATPKKTPVRATPQTHVRTIFTLSGMRTVHGQTPQTPGSVRRVISKGGKGSRSRSSSIRRRRQRQSQRQRQRQSKSHNRTHRRH